MQRKWMLILLVAFCVCGLAFAQTEVFDGYCDMPWGTGIERFKAKYPSAEEVAEKDYVQKELGADFLIFTIPIERIEGTGISFGRTNEVNFWFYKNKLCAGHTVQYITSSFELNSVWHDDAATQIDSRWMEMPSVCKEISPKTLMEFGVASTTVIDTNHSEGSFMQVLSNSYWDISFKKMYDEVTEKSNTNFLEKLMKDLLL